jgi:hypothetical protein
MGLLETVFVEVQSVEQATLAVCCQGYDVAVLVMKTGLELVSSRLTL